MEIRLQKRIAESGICSRRMAEKLIVEGRISVNDEIKNELGAKVKISDTIKVDGKIIDFNNEKIVIAMNKPRGVLCSKSDPHYENTIMNLLPEKYQMLNPVGRLDKDSEGLIILTNDGELHQRLSHPKFAHIKIYHVKVKGELSRKALEKLETREMELNGKKLNPMPFTILNTNTLEIHLSEGRSRQIRRVMDLLGFPVLQLRRIAIGSVKLNSLAEGHFRTLNKTECSAL